MCACNPELKTPYCGKPGCEWPGFEPQPTTPPPAPAPGFWRRFGRFAAELGAQYFMARAGRK